MGNILAWSLLMPKLESVEWCHAFSGRCAFVKSLNNSTVLLKSLEHENVIDVPLYRQNQSVKCEIYRIGKGRL